MPLCDADTVETSLRSGAFDFVDFGCSNGQSMAFATSQLGAARGLGIDIDARKVEETRALGFEAVQYDLTELGGLPDVVSFCILSHFLEHLPGYPAAKRCIDAAIAASRDFVLIRHPWFDADMDLFLRGLKFYWSDWRGHTHHMRAFDVYRAVLRNEKVKEVRLLGRERIADSGHNTILPLSAALDRHHYDAARDGAKPEMAFDFPAFRETVCLVRLSGRPDLDAIIAKLGGCEPIYSGTC